MASSSGTTTTTTTSSGSEEDLQTIMDQKKKNRMISNRESARRSRMKKQKHLDDLTTQLSQLRKKNNEMISSVNITTQRFVNVEMENLVLRTQVAELSHQLHLLNDIIDFMYGGDGGCGGAGGGGGGGGGGGEFVDELMSDSLSYAYANQPILASAEMFMY